MSDAYLTIQTLGFATGTVLFAMLFFLVRKAKRLTGGPGHSILAPIAACMWNAGNLTIYLALLAGWRESSPVCRAGDAVAYSGTAMLSTGFFLMQASRGEQPWQARRNRWFRNFSYAVAATLTAGFFAAIATPAFPIRFTTLMELSAYNLPFHIAAGLILFHGRGEATGAFRTYVRVMLAMVSGLALALLFLIHFATGGSWSVALTVLAQQSSIPMALVSFIFLARFRFADVFVKQSFIILAAVILVPGYNWMVVESLASAARASAAYPQPTLRIITTALWAALLLAFPLLKRTIDRAADRWLFNRPDYRQLAQAFALESEQAGSEQRLFALAEQHVRDALQVEHAAVLPESPRSEMIAGAKIEQFAPIKVSGETAYQLAVAPGSGERKLLSDEIDFLSSLAERIGRRIEALRFERERRERELRETRLQHSLTEAELRALQAQVNPHFLFNTLNTIADLITSEPEKAELMTERLAEVFRYALQRTGINLISVAEEFEFLQTYLSIEQARFGKRLRVEMTVDPQIASARLPSLILQPLVENAIKHGIAPKLEGGTLRIGASGDDKVLRLTVEDNGAGWREAHAGNGHGIGLRNVRERLRTLYESSATMEISTAPGSGTRICITIPKDETQNTDRGRRGAGEVATAEADRRAS
ncbi:MAG: sensor histidine kinase [Blastocatellia bacterium]